MVAIVGITRTLESRREREGGHIERTTMGGGVALVHELHGTCTIVCTRGIEVNFQVTNGLQRSLELEVLASRNVRGRGY